MTTQAVVPAEGGNPARPVINAPTGATLRITDTKLYVPVVTLSIQDDNKLLQQLRIGFKHTIKWNKYRSELSNQNKNTNLNLSKPIDYLCYRLKMKITEHFFQSAIHQMLK